MLDNFYGIKKLYLQYGFEEEECGENYAVFSLPSNIYPGVDILSSDEKTAQLLKAKYAENSYSTNILESIDLIDIDINLYTRFLRPKVAKTNLLKRYDSYINKIQNAYRDSEDGMVPPYQYIEVDYRWEQNFKPFHGKSNLIHDITRLLEKKGPRLIIVEAAAGFGKTSTSYELLKTLCKQDNINRPFLMELERERQASTFRYLMLSQIDSTFEVQLKNDIVVDNIKKGRIPVIVDGFDELLSKDLDSGKESIKSGMVETMLSTIASLLVGETKIVLTSRKTAIFSDEAFQEWSIFQKEQHNRVFEIDRFQLLDPLPEKWLDKHILHRLPESIARISNPVLLSFLKYSNFIHESNEISGSTLVKRFFSSLYARERTRQQIPFKATEQEEILEKVAITFALFDITADKRSTIKDTMLELNQRIIGEYVENNKDFDELLNKLVNHALLDRHDNGLVGFINDFVYGSLMARALVTKRETLLGEITELSYANTLRIIDACSALDLSERSQIAHALKCLKGILPEIDFQIEVRLLNSITTRHYQLYQENQRFVSLIFEDTGWLDELQFIDCYFESCFIDGARYNNCIFINCEFKDCIFSRVLDSCDFYNCVGIEQSSIQKDNILPIERDLDLAILNMFFRLGSDNSRIRKVSGILRELSKTHDRRNILKHIDRLNSKQYIYIDGNNAWIRQLGSDYYKNHIS